MNHQENKLPHSAAQTSAGLVNIVTAAYASAVAGLSTLTGDNLKKARNRLFWGSRIGSKVEGVRDQISAEQMLRRSIMSGGLMRPPFQDSNGNNVYCFKLSHHYAGKGKTTYVRISDLKEKGELFISNVSIGVDYDEVKDIDRLKLQAPKVRYINSNIVTVVLTPDNLGLVEWYCGEPKKVYTHINDLLDRNSEIDFDKVWIQLGVDFDLRTRDKKRRLINEREHKAPVEKSHSNSHTPAPLASVASALEVAVQHHEEEVISSTVTVNEAVPSEEVPVVS